MDTIPANEFVSEAWLQFRDIVWDPTATGVPRYTHRATGSAIVRQPYMTDAQWLKAKVEFGEKFRPPL